MSTPVASHQELGVFLRAHRALLQPEDFGLPSSSRRRTPGLRREEVASLSGVSLAWYTWLEQGRVVASRQVLESVGRALRFDDTELRHVLRLAGYHEAEPVAAAPELGGSIQAVLDSLPRSPSVLLDRHFDLMAWNAAWSALLGKPSLIPADRRNLMWLMVADTRLRRVIRHEDWEPLAMSVFRHFRAQTGTYPPDEKTAGLYERLTREVPELSHWWGCHSVGELTARPVTVEPEGAAPVRFGLSSFRPVDDASALVLLLTPASPADSERMAALLEQPLRVVRAADPGPCRVS